MNRLLVSCLQSGALLSVSNTRHSSIEPLVRIREVLPEVRQPGLLLVRYFLQHSRVGPDYFEFCQS